MANIVQGNLVGFSKYNNLLNLYKTKGTNYLENNIGGINSLGLAATGSVYTGGVYNVTYVASASVEYGGNAATGHSKFACFTNSDGSHGTFQEKPASVEFNG